ncbi:MAG: tRNA (adenosine(37)-N6)-threonylcarbamoyltransferase complex ATPase subunit type 1 TsaE [Candidatus Andersenbacteria bacterium]
MENLEGEIVLPDLQALEMIAIRLAEQLTGGDVVLLKGELGAGKTTFTQMLAHALGAQERVPSPTFTIEARYPLSGAQAQELVHIDLYRLSSLQGGSEDTLHFQELFDGSREQGRIVVVEWAERLGSTAPPSFWELQFKHGSSGNSRTVIVTHHV